MRRLALFFALTIFLAAAPQPATAQESDPDSWAVSEEPTFQMEVKEGEQVLVDHLGYLWVHRTRERIIEIFRGRVGDEGFQERPSIIPFYRGLEFWDVYDSTGRNVRTVTTPKDVMVQTIGKDYIFGSWTDAESGVQHVRIYTLDREPEQWSVSEEPTVQMEVKEGSKILVDPLGYLWVKTPFLIYRGGVVSPPSPDRRTEPLPPRQGPGMRAWDVFDSAGKLVTGIVLPPDVTIREIGEDFIQGIWTDKEGKDYVRMYSLDRGG